MRVLSISGMLMWLWGIRGSAQDPHQITPETEDAFGKILEFLYTIAHWVGQVVTSLVQSIVPTMAIPDSLVDAIGLLALITAFLVLAEVAKRLAWILVAIGWILIVARIVIVALQASS
jgi:hypothetical protein